MDGREIFSSLRPFAIKNEKSLARPKKLQKNLIQRSRFVIASVAGASRVDVLHFGHKRKFCDACPMSALPPKADIAERNRDVRFVPQADSCTAAILSLFDPQ
jgi:hypothetical protein